MRACFAIAIDTQMKHGGVKAKCFVDHSTSKMTYNCVGWGVNFYTITHFCGPFCENKS